MAGRSAGAVELVANVDDPVGHPRGVDHRVVFGLGADMAGQLDDAFLQVRLHVVVVRDQRGALQRLLDVQVDIDRVGVVTDVDVVRDVADTGQPRHGGFGGGALRAVGHGARQSEVAVVCGRLHALRHGDVPLECYVRCGGQHRVIAEVARRQHYLQMVVHPGHPGDPPRGGGRLQVPRVALHRAVECYLAVDVPDGDVLRVDARVEAELGFDRRTDILGLTHWPESSP